MLYHSTRSKETMVDSAQAVLNGLAPDGGLYVPQALPQVNVAEILNMDRHLAKHFAICDLPYQEVMQYINGEIAHID